MPYLIFIYLICLVSRQMNETGFVYEYQTLQPLDPAIDEPFANPCRKLMNAGFLVLGLMVIFYPSFYDLVSRVAEFVMWTVLILALVFVLFALCVELILVLFGGIAGWPEG